MRHLKRHVLQILKTRRTVRRRRRSQRRPLAQPAVDRLVSLPDDILVSIFSAIPVKQWPAFAVLSRQMRLFFSRLPRCECFRVNIDSFCGPLPIFPHRLLRRLVVVFSGTALDSTDYLRMIMERAVEVGVQELVLENNRKSDVYIPSIVLGIKSLKVISFSKCTIPNASWPWRIPALLRTLRIEKCPLSEHVLGPLLRHCSYLEKLHLVHCKSTCTKIHSASLKHLWLQSASCIKRIEIAAPGLRTLTLYTCRRLQTLSLHGPRVEKAFLNLAYPVYCKPNVRLRSFLLAAKGLTCLTLRRAAVNFLAEECNYLDKLDVSFKKLRILSISLNGKDESHAMLLLKLLESCPRLLELKLSIVRGRRTKQIVDLDEHMERLRRLVCLQQSLKQVTLRVLLSVRYEHEILRLFATEAKVMKKMKLQLPGKRVNKTVKNILSSTKAAVTRKKFPHHTEYIIEM